MLAESVGYSPRAPARSSVVKGKAMLSINDHPDIRRCFEGFHVLEVPIKYTVGGGQGVDRIELIISSWDVAAEPAGLF